MKILITGCIPEPGLSVLREHDVDFDLIGTGKDTVEKRVLIRTLKKHPYDGMLTMLTDTVDAEVLDAGSPGLRIVANYAVGFNNISLDAARERNIIVTNTPGALTNTVAEHTFGLILAAARRIPEADAFVRSNRFRGWKPDLFLGVGLAGKTLGIIGAGRIGSRVAEIGNSFGMKIVYHDMRKNDALEEATAARMMQSPEDVLIESDVVSVHLPLTDQTHHFLDERRLGYMKPSAILVNTSRGPIIEESALAAVLKAKQLFGAALDVFENEPSVSRDLRGLSNVILTPHIASASTETRGEMARMAADNIVAVLHGGKPINPVV